MKKIGVLQFPGSNCDKDVFKAIIYCQTGSFHFEDTAQSKYYKPEFLVSSERIDIKDYKAFIIPGGFSYGDYLRAGAMARFSPVMQDLIQAGKKGWPILGICNGFQVLCESGLLEGALLPNKQGRFLDKWSHLKLENKNSFWQSKQELKLPIAHGEGSYYIPDNQLKSMQDNNQIWLSYKENPNGSVNNIAGVMNKKANIVGLMPHPERALTNWMGGTDGLSFFQSLFH